MKSETIVIGQRRIAAEWHHGRSRKKLVITCHGYQSSGANSTLAAITSGLNKAGRDTVTFDFSTNLGGFDIEHQAQDVAQVIKHFDEYDEIVLLAASFGALTAAIATVQNPKVTGLVTLNGFFGRSQLGQEYRKTYLKFRAAALVVPKYRKILKYFKRELRPGLIKAPTLVVHSKVDTDVLIVQSQNFYRMLTGPKQFMELESANHGITAIRDRGKIIGMINKWLAEAQGTLRVA
jgi:alpha-beta hydrolase superfamily lysophospholipase